MRGKARGVASIIEVLMVSLVISLLIAVAFMFFSGYYSAVAPDIKYRDVDVVLCGRVLTIKNVGEAPVTVTGAWGAYYVNLSGGVDVYTEDLTAIVKGVIEPGEAVNYRLGRAYDYVIIAVDEVRLPPAQNNCVPRLVETGGGGG